MPCGLKPYPPASTGGARYVARVEACVTGKPKVMNMYVPTSSVVGAKEIWRGVIKLLTF
jgi:hypothetical protein